MIMEAVISRLVPPPHGFHINALSRWRRRRRRRRGIHHHGYGAGFLVLSRVDSTTRPSNNCSCSSCSSRSSSSSSSAWLLRREAVRIIDGGVGFGGFQAIDFRGSGRWNVAAGALIAAGNGNDGRCQAMKKGRDRGVVQQQEKNPERREDGRSKLKDKEQTGQSVVGFAGLASLKAQLFPQASVESSLTMNTTVEQEQIVARTIINREVPKNIPSSNISKTEVEPSSIQSSQANHQVANKGESLALKKADDQNSFKKVKKASVVIRTGEAFATEKRGVTAAAAEKRRKTLSEGSAYGGRSGENERGSSKGAAILAAMQKAAALERAKASQRRKSGGGNLQYKMDGQTKEEAPAEEGPPKPIVLKPEWNDQIQSLEKLLHELKQARYD